MTDETAVECHELFQSEQKKMATGGACETAFSRLIPELMYQKKAEKLLADENCMKLYLVSREKALLHMFLYTYKIYFLVSSIKKSFN